MRKNYLLVILAFLLTGNGIAQNLPSYVPKDGLVGYWPFNGNANDESGNGNHGTPINVSYASDRFGNLNSASNFPNGNTNSEIIIGEKINPKKFTISVWVRATGQRNDGFHSIISRINQYNTPELPPNNFELQVSCPDQTYTVWTGFGGNNVWQPAAPGLGFGNNSSELNKWNHLILTFDGLEGKTYTNGKLFISQNIVNYNNETSVLSFGDRHNGPNYEFNWWGDLDDIAIYNRALTEQEITALYTSTPPCASTTAAITTSDSTTFCQGGSAILTATTTSASTPIYQWYNNDQAITNATQNTYKATTAGKYTVKVVDGACEAVSLAKEVTVNPLPTATISPSGNVSTICDGSALTLVADGGVNYKWNTGSTENKITVSKEGPYYADVINQFGCKSVVWQDVVVEALPVVTINNLKQIAFKNDNAIQLEGTPKGGIFTGEGVNGNTFNPEKTGLGKKTITYSYSTTNGCKGEAKETIIVVDSLGNVCSSTKYDTVTVTNNVTKYDTVIVPKTVTKYDTVKVNTYDTITVTNNVTKYDTVIVKTNVFDTVKVNKYDTITVTNNVTKYDTVIVTKTVTKYDTVKVNTYDTITITNNVTKYDTVLVNKYDTITVTDTVSILKINFKLTTGIKANQMTSMSIYPNPTSDLLIIDASDLAAVTGYSYRILDALGKEVYNALVTAAKTEISLKTIGAKGMYVLHILDANKQSVQTKQIVLE